ncbi:hypothetical protein MCOR25_006572 [Pyricularia grisea]|uniref:Heme haloperoxidase family profile domain-containing protein n=1 Tax=Pyricularia grisea TaxID=148305 RepID=A0A6P8BJT6_PYRGI|nr:uncharacterized protein PgNI_01286 [Pyricularia grisea]KAI6361107.1 hypothetical protein MCOR25_006572 [Pyricularia grisea]TLD17156.1 hypothetical protein PgNI_01286 [Pyricularia grisea]
MVSTRTFAALLGTVVPLTWAYPSMIQARDDHPFNAHGPNDRKSPCPMMNTLANHGFIPRTNISMDQLVSALELSIGLEGAATRIVGGKALSTSTTGDPNTFNLEDITKHGMLEHDGSLSRSDLAEGDNHSFNKTIWENTLTFFKDDKISIAQGAAARNAAIAAAKVRNPTFCMADGDVENSAIESALYLRVFGGVNGDARKDWVKILFEEERMPYAEGFPRNPTGNITAQEILAIASKLTAA